MEIWDKLGKTHQEGEEHVKGRKRNEEEEKLRETIKEERINILVKGNVKEGVKGKLEEIEFY